MSRFSGTKGPGLSCTVSNSPIIRKLVSLAGAYRDKLSFRGGTGATSENHDIDRTITIL